MKIVDLDYQDTMYNKFNNTSPEIAKLNYPQKYLKLVTRSGEVYDLEISDVTDNEFYLIIKE